MRYLILLSVLCMPVWANQRIQGWCERGGQPIVAPVTVGGPPQTVNVQRSFPTCSVSVFITGSGGTFATIFSNNTGTVLANPFQADTFGFWAFFVGNGTYDVQI